MYRAAVGAAGVAGTAGLAGLAGCSQGESGKVLPPRLEGKPVAETSEIPLGGGKILSEAQVVITQPVKGTFKAFTSQCTHQGCQVGGVEDGVIECPCHGSKFAIADGSVKQGPATVALPDYPVHVKNGQVVLG